MFVTINFGCQNTATVQWYLCSSHSNQMSNIFPNLKSNSLIFPRLFMSVGTLWYKPQPWKMTKCTLVNKFLKWREKQDLTDLPIKVNSFLVAVTDIHLRVMTRSAAGPAISPVISDTSGGAAVNRLFYLHTAHDFLVQHVFKKKMSLHNFSNTWAKNETISIIFGMQNHEETFHQQIINMSCLFLGSFFTELLE